MILMLNRPGVLRGDAGGQFAELAVPVNFRLTPPELAYLVENCGAAVLITEPMLAPVAAAVREIAPLHHLIVAESPSSDGVLGYEDLVAEEGEPAPRLTSPATARR